jgi:hypothetical protein
MAGLEPLDGALANSGLPGQLGLRQAQVEAAPAQSPPDFGK